ncbi:MAG: cytochrome c maturation protein CcmE [Sphingobacteriaceae bacterium]|jgi:cytochrome c-type biogenesis protein CcmE|nr:cytochrome c maturation protein CcmE [Sphingobacteriaceae bacterium]
MKKIHIVGIVVIAVAIGVILTSLKSSSTYADFNEAIANPDKEFHVVGKLQKSQPLIYDPKVNPDEFIFTLIDNKGVEKQVVLHKSKPQDFERSEQIVIIGKMHGEQFHANDILMKCPSKYNETKPQS